MAATSKPNKIQQDRTRSAIQTTQLVKRLQDFALDLPGSDGQPVKLEPDRQRAIETLLRKTLPDLKSIEISGTGEGGAIGITFKTIYQSE